MPAKKKKAQAGQTINELAKNFKKNAQVIRSICAQLDSVGKRGRFALYDPKQVKPILDKQIDRSKKPPEVKELERRKLELQCQKLEIENDTALRKLVPVDEVIRHVQSMCTQVRTHLLSMPAECAPLVVGHDDREVERILRERHIKMLTKLQALKFE